MSSRKQRIDPHTMSPTLSRSQQQSQFKVKHLSKSKCRNTTTNANARLPGFEDLAQFDNDGMPFILVDGMCTRNRQQLHLALSKCEKRRMKWIQRQCCALPLLKYIKPAMKAEPRTAAEKDARAEQDFQEDLKQLCITKLTAGESFQREGTKTPIAHCTSNENLVHETPRLKEIRSQLQELRHKQMVSPILSSKKCDRPKFMRQDTFDVHREDRLARTLFGGSKSCFLETPISSSMHNSIGDKSNTSQSQLVRSATMNQPWLSNSRPKLPKLNSSSCLFKDKSTNQLSESRRNIRDQSVHSLRAIDFSKVQSPITMGSLENHASCSSSRAAISNHKSITLQKKSTISNSALDADQVQVESSSIYHKSRTFLQMSSRLFKKLKN